MDRVSPLPPRARLERYRGRRFVAIVATAMACAMVPDSRGGGLRLATATAADPALEAAVRFVERFQRELSFVVADEEYVQHRIANHQPSVVRTIRGEIFLTYLPEERHWVTVHDFVEVDGAPVAERLAVRDWLVRRPVGRLAPTLAAHNARYNLGNVFRNFNEPTLALQLLQPWRVERLRVSRLRTTVRDGRRVVTLRLREHERPTLVSSVGGAAVFADAELDVDAETGAIWRTLLRIPDRTVEASLETTYAMSDSLRMAVPVVFTERYAARDDRLAEVITCRSEYSNYRRFEVAGRLVVEER
jgi:hypothetical protein